MPVLHRFSRDLGGWVGGSEPRLGLPWAGSAATGVPSRSGDAPGTPPSRHSSGDGALGGAERALLLSLWPVPYRGCPGEQLALRGEGWG